MNYELRNRAYYRTRSPIDLLDDDDDFSEEDELQRQMILERMRMQRDANEGNDYN